MFSSFLHHPTYFTTTKEGQNRGKNMHTAQPKEVYSREDLRSENEKTTTIYWQI